MATPGLGVVTWRKFEGALKKHGCDSAYLLTKARHKKEGMSSARAAEESSREWLSALRAVGECMHVPLGDGDYLPGRFTIEGLKALLPAAAVGIADALAGGGVSGDVWGAKQLAVLRSGRQCKDSEAIRWATHRSSIPIEQIEVDDIPGPQAVTFLRAYQNDHSGQTKQYLTQIVKMDPDFGEKGQDGDVDLRSTLAGMLDACGRDGAIDPTKGVEGLDLAAGSSATASSG